MKRSYSGVGALSLASLTSQRTLVSACQLLSCLSGPPWATFAPQLNAAWITEMHRNAMSGGACFARYRRSMESQAGAGRIAYCTQSSPTGPFLQEYVLTLETRDPTLCQAVNVC